jgi:hypothetical protein
MDDAESMEVEKHFTADGAITSWYWHRRCREAEDGREDED